MDADREAGQGGAADVLLELLAARDLHARAVEQARRLRAEGAVHEGLQVADLHPRVAEAAAHVDLGELVGLLGRERLPDPQAERALVGEALPEAQGAEPAVLVVHRGHAPRGRELDPGAHRLDVLVVGRLDVAVAEVPARFLAQDAGRLAALVELDHAARDLQVAVCVGQGGGVQPDRVGVARHQRNRTVGGDRVERFLRRLDRWRPVAAAPTAAAQPDGCRRTLQCLAHARDGLVHRGRALEPHLVLGESPGGEVHVRVGEAGQHAAAAEIDALRPGERGLVGADTACDLVARDRERLAPAAARAPSCGRRRSRGSRGEA